MTTIIRVLALSGRRGIRIAPVAVAAGWPSPAQDYYSGDLDLNEHLIQDPDATFIVRVSGDSMLQAGISHGDELIVDRSLEPRHGSIVIAIVDGEFTVKRLELFGESGQPQLRLKAENPRYPDIYLGSESELNIWGVVTTCLHHVRR